jgi:hypothetical protein
LIERSGLRVAILFAESGGQCQRGLALIMGTIAENQTSSTGSGHCMLEVGAKRVQWDTGGETSDWEVSLGRLNDRACAEESGCSIEGAVGSSLLGTSGRSFVGCKRGFVSTAGVLI